MCIKSLYYIQAVEPGFVVIPDRAKATDTNVRLPEQNKEKVASLGVYDIKCSFTRTNARP